MHIALVSCDHGLGHLRRCRLVASELVGRGCRVTVFCRIEDWGRLDDAGMLGASDSAIELVDFATNTSPKDLRSGAAAARRWESELPDLDPFDVVISDTLPEILSRRPDSHLIAQFFWHDVLDGIDPAYRERAQSLLSQHQPRIFGSSMFAMPAVTSQPGFSGVGLFGRTQPGVRRRSDSHALLITGGSTMEARAVFEDALADLGDDTASRTFTTIWIDPQLRATGPHLRGQPATFEPAMYANLGLAVIRPGLGVVTELIAYRVPMILLYERGNRELTHNARVLVSAGLAVDPAKDQVPLRARLDPGQWWRPPARWPLVNGPEAVADLILGRP